MNIRPIILIGLASVLGLGCTNTQEPLPVPADQPPVQTAPSATSDEQPLQAEVPEEVSSDASLLAEGPILWEPNEDFNIDDYIITVTSTPIIQWMKDGIRYHATPDNLCIDEAYQTPEDFTSNIISKFKDEDRYYYYVIKPADELRGHGWRIDIIPNRHGYTTEQEINNTFAWVGGCEAGSVGLYTFNDNWIAYGDGCHQSGGPNKEEACHAAMDALYDMLELK